MTVVGVVGDVKEFYDVEAAWYRPYAQHAASRAAGRMVFAVRSQSEAVIPLGMLRRAITAVDPGLPIFNAITSADLYSQSFSRQGQAATLGSVFAAFALLLAAIGIYGSISYRVSRRTREIGVRMALGCDRRAILRDIADEGGRLVVAGTAIGLVGALIVARFLASALTEVGAFDLVTFVASALALALAGFAATLIPALRATRIDPVEALRHE